MTPWWTDMNWTVHSSHFFNFASNELMGPPAAKMYRFLAPLLSAQFNSDATLQPWAILPWMNRCNHEICHLCRPHLTLLCCTSLLHGSSAHLSTSQESLHCSRLPSLLMLQAIPKRYRHQINLVWFRWKSRALVWFWWSWVRLNSSRPLPPLKAD